MKCLVTLLLILPFPTLLSAQVYLDEDFGGGTFPPSRWIIDSHSANWSANFSENAGGTAPEAEFSWAPVFSGTSRLITPQIDLTGVTDLKVEFKHMADYNDTPMTVGVATRSGGGSWNTVWQVSLSGDIPPTTLTVGISNNDVGAADFQMCWFVTVSDFNINSWYFDDIKLYQSLDHDVMAREILVDDQIVPGETVAPSAIVENFGTNMETFDVTCDISVGGGVVYSDHRMIAANAGEIRIIQFTGYVASASDELFDITVITHLDGDLNPSNDTATGWFNTYTTEREMVVLEMGTGTWCQACPGAAMGADDMIDNGHDVAVVEYHRNDDFSESSGEARLVYYQVVAYPTAIFDGTEKYEGGSYDQSMYPAYLPIYQEKKAINTAFTMEIYGDNIGNDYSLTIRINKTATIPYQNLKLFVILTESDILYSWYQLDHLNWVERLMIPNSEGTDIDMMSNEVLDVGLDFTFNSEAWDIENCELTAFIQNADDKEILQATKIMVPDLNQVGIGDDTEALLPTVTALKGNYPNPFNASTTIKYSLSKNGLVTIKMFDILGREIATLVDGDMQAGEHSVTFNASELSTGLYFYRMEAEDFAETQKMLLIK